MFISSSSLQLIAELFDPKYGMFEQDPDTNQLWFSQSSLESSQEYELIGMLLGLAIYNSVILDLRFPPIVYSKLLARKPTLHDLAVAFPREAQPLIDLLAFEGPLAGPGSVEDVYCANFTVNREIFGAVETLELKKGGADIPLTSENRSEYVDLKVDWILNKSVMKQYTAFHSGFQLVAGGEALRTFTPEELQLLVCGSEAFDFEELEKGAKYEDGYTKSSRVIQDLWTVLHSLSLEEKKKFLFFCTGSDRAPILGLRAVNLTISRNGADSNRLPTAHTCFNHLLLPNYSSQEKLRELLLKAIHHSQGFGLR